MHMAQPVARALATPRASRGNHRHKRLFMATEGALEVRHRIAAPQGGAPREADNLLPCHVSIPACLPATSL